MPDKEKPTNPEIKAGPRLIPLSPAAVQKGIESALHDGDKGWEIALRDLSGQVSLREAMESTESLRRSLSGQNEWGQALADVSGGYYQGGAAAYWSCLRTESSLSGLPAPRITEEDIEVWAARGLAPLGRRLPPAETALAASEANFREFLNLQADFAAGIDELDWRERDGFSIKLGAADLYGLIKAHYDRLDQPVWVPDKTSWLRD
jgi:hypothetical protein